MTIRKMTVEERRIMTAEAGVLYVVATPIGNLDDLGARALSILRSVHAIYAEDTRHSAVLLRHHGVSTPVQTLHEHNEDARIALIRARLLAGESLALISDAGTPLISDPGFRLVRALRSEGLRISPVPGACAAIAALSVAGLPTDRFSFEGFLPAKSAARRERLQAVSHDPRTLVFYEAPHRIAELLSDAEAVFGAERPAVLVRELTKTFETVLALPLAQLREKVHADSDQQRGEIILLIAGDTERDADAETAEMDRVLTVLLPELPLKQAVALAEKLTGLPGNQLYKRALQLKNG